MALTPRSRVRTIALLLGMVGAYLLATIPAGIADDAALHLIAVRAVLAISFLMVCCVLALGRGRPA